MDFVRISLCLSIDLDSIKLNIHNYISFALSYKRNKLNQSKIFCLYSLQT